MVMRDENQKAIFVASSSTGLLSAMTNKSQGVSESDASTMYTRAECSRPKRKYNPNSFCDHYKFKGHYRWIAIS